MCVCVCVCVCANQLRTTTTKVLGIPVIVVIVFKVNQFGFVNFAFNNLFVAIAYRIRWRVGCLDGRNGGKFFGKLYAIATMKSVNFLFDSDLLANFKFWFLHLVSCL